MVVPMAADHRGATAPPGWAPYFGGLLESVPESGRRDADGVLPSFEAADELTLMFGTDEWGAIYHDRVAGILAGREAAEKYLNLMRWRLEKVSLQSVDTPARCRTRRSRLIRWVIRPTASAATGDVCRVSAA